MSTTPKQRAEWARLSDAIPADIQSCAEHTENCVCGTILGSNYAISIASNDSKLRNPAAKFFAAAREAVPALLADLAEAHEAIRDALLTQEIWTDPFCLVCHEDIKGGAAAILDPAQHKPDCRALPAILAGMHS